MHGCFNRLVAKLFTALAAVRTGAAGSTFTCTESDEQGARFTAPRWPKRSDHLAIGRTANVGDERGDRRQLQRVLRSARPHARTRPFVELRALGATVGFGRSSPVPDSPSARVDGVRAGAMSSARCSGTAGRGDRGWWATGDAPPTMELGQHAPRSAIVDTASALAPILWQRRVMTTGTGGGSPSQPMSACTARPARPTWRGFVARNRSASDPRRSRLPILWFVRARADLCDRGSRPDAAAGSRFAVVVLAGERASSAAGPLAMRS